MSNLVMVSGGYDPVHVGHIRQFKEASKYGRLVVVLNSDEWLLRKKGYVFMPYDERREILYTLKPVYRVFPQVGHGDTMAQSILKYKPTIFCKGGDRTKDTMPRDELDACEQVGCDIIYGVGGGKVQSSSWLVDKLREKIRRT